MKLSLVVSCLLEDKLYCNHRYIIIIHRLDDETPSNLCALSEPIALAHMAESPAGHTSFRVHHHKLIRALNEKRES